MVNFVNMTFERRRDRTARKRPEGGTPQCLNLLGGVVAAVCLFGTKGCESPASVSESVGTPDSVNLGLQAVAQQSSDDNGGGEPDPCGLTPAGPLSAFVAEFPHNSNVTSVEWVEHYVEFIRPFPWYDHPLGEYHLRVDGTPENCRVVDIGLTIPDWVAVGSEEYEELSAIMANYFLAESSVEDNSWYIEYTGPTAELEDTTHYIWVSVTVHDGPSGQIVSDLLEIDIALGPPNLASVCGCWTETIRSRTPAAKPGFEWGVAIRVCNPASVWWRGPCPDPPFDP